MGQEVSKPPEGASGVPEAALNVSVPTAGEPAASNLSRSHSAHMLSHAVPPAVCDERHRRAHTWQHRGQQRSVYTRAPWPARGGSSTPGPSDTESEASVSESGGLSRTGSSNRVKRSISEASDCSELGEDRPRGPGHGGGHHGNSGTWPRMPKRSSSSSQLRHDRLDVWELTHALAREKSDLSDLPARMTSEVEARGEGNPAPPALNHGTSLATTTTCTIPAIVSPSQPIRQSALISDYPVAPAAGGSGCTSDQGAEPCTVLSASRHLRLGAEAGMWNDQQHRRRWKQHASCTWR